MHISIWTRLHFGEDNKGDLRHLWSLPHPARFPTFFYASLIVDPYFQPSEVCDGYNFNGFRNLNSCWEISKYKIICKNDVCKLLLVMLISFPSFISLLLLHHFVFSTIFKHGSNLSLHLWPSSWTLPMLLNWNWEMASTPTFFFSSRSERVVSLVWGS